MQGTEIDDPETRKKVFVNKIKMKTIILERLEALSLSLEQDEKSVFVGPEV